MTEAIKKKQWRKIVASATHYFISDMECPKEERVTMRGAVNQFLSFEKRTLYFKKLAIRIKVLVCENTSSRTSSPFMMADYLGKVFARIDIADSVSEKIT